MKVSMCGLWDGTNLWVQWDDIARGVGYQLEVRMRIPGAEQWEAWRGIGGLRPLRKAWLVVPMWKPGYEAQARVCVAVEDREWVEASEVTFARSRCRFEITAGPRGVHYEQGSEFSSIVDGAACHYELREEIELGPGESAETEMTASLITGYCQLDAPDDFYVRPSLGLVIRNVAPSVDDLIETGNAVTVLRVMPRPGPTAEQQRGNPLKVAFGRNFFR